MKLRLFLSQIIKPKFIQTGPAPAASEPISTPMVMNSMPAPMLPSTISPRLPEANPPFTFQQPSNPQEMTALALGWLQHYAQVQSPQQHGLVNPMGTSQGTRIELGGFAPYPSVKVEELTDSGHSPPASPPAEQSRVVAKPNIASRAVVQPSSLAVPRLEAASSTAAAPSTMLMGTMRQAKGCSDLKEMEKFMAATEGMLGKRAEAATADTAEVVDLSEAEEGKGDDGDSESTKTKKARLSPPVASATAKGKAKAKPKPMPKDDKVLKYPGTGKHAAIKYGQCTIYMDSITQCWRLKKQPGSKALEHFYFKGKRPETVWKEVVKETKKHA